MYLAWYPLIGKHWARACYFHVTDTERITLLQVGKNLIVCVATNPTSFLTKSCNFTLTVKDQQMPIIANCPSVNYLVNASATAATALVLLSQFLTVTDNIQVSSTGLVCSPNGVTSPYAFPMGVSTVNCSAKDIFNNTALCTFSLRVQDATPPVFASCPMVSTHFHWSM